MKWKELQLLHHLFWTVQQKRTSHFRKEMQMKTIITGNKMKPVTIAKRRDILRRIAGHYTANQQGKGKQIRQQSRITWLR